jgi:hypothetical protein
MRVSSRVSRAFTAAVLALLQPHADRKHAPVRMQPSTVHARQEEPMHKLKLRLEDLRIDSFTTTEVRREKGTVYGEQCTCHTACTCPGCPTCDASCNGTCGGSCNGTCDASCNGTCGCGTADYSCAGTCGEYGCATYATYGGREGVCELCAAW